MEPKENPPKALYRSSKQRIIAGVCGGFAEYFQVDVAIVRVLWLLSLLFHGIGLAAYLICALVIKSDADAARSVDKKDEKTPDSTPADRSDSSTAWVVVVVIMILVLLFGVRIFHHAFPPFRPHFGLDWNFNRYEDILSFILILIGVIFVATRARSGSAGDEGAARLMRSKNKRMIGGVCGGLANLWQIDVAWIRLSYIALSLAVNVLAGVIIYLILLIAIPEEKPNNNA